MEKYYICILQHRTITELLSSDKMGHLNKLKKLAALCTEELNF